MIYVNLVDETTRVKHIRFFVVPATSKRHFACSPDDALPLRSVVRISRRLDAGRKCGRVGKFLWYRLIATPTAGHGRGRQPSLGRRAAPAATR